MPAEHQNSRPTAMDSKSAHHVNKIKSIPVGHAPMVKNIWTQPTKVSFDKFVPLSVPNPLPLASPTSFPATNLQSSSRSMLSPSSSAPAATDGTILTGSSLPIPPQVESNSPALSPSAPVLGGLISGTVLLLSILLCSLYRRIKKAKKQRMAVGQHYLDHHLTDTRDIKNWNQTQIWSTLTSTASSNFTEMDVPPPAYCCTNQSKKRWTQDSVTSKQGSFVKQYNPQLAYSPSHSILHMDHDGVSPSHTLVDTSGASWLHQKDTNPSEYNAENQQQQQQQQQQRRSIQPYQAQLDIASSFSDALLAPGPYHSGILLHTKEFRPSSTS